MIERLSAELPGELRVFGIGKEREVAEEVVEDVRGGRISEIARVADEGTDRELTIREHREKLDRAFESLHVPPAKAGTIDQTTIHLG